MDANGIEWCKSNRATIVGWLQEAEQNFARDTARVGRGDGKEPTPEEVAKAKNGKRWQVGWAAAKRLFWISPVDPFGSFVDEAIRRAEVNDCR